jgi:multiple sugar transport system substrate-binding protein/sn-glycerol 3-phosphate transport system substrate-binding protein
MRNLRKWPIWLLMGLMLFVLASCGNGQENGAEATLQRTLRVITPTPRKTGTPTITPTPLVPVLAQDELSGVEIEFWYTWAPPEPDSLAEVVNWFNLENEYGIEVIPRAFSQPADLEAEIEASESEGAPPNLVLAHPYQYLEWADADWQVDLTPYLESAAYGIGEEQLAEFYPAFVERDVYGAERLGFPGLFNAQVILYNQTWAQELGFSGPPQNAAGLRQQACAAAEESDGLEGGWIIDPSQAGAAAWLLAFAGKLEEGGRYLLDSEEVEDAFTFLANLREDECAWQPEARYPDEDFIERRGLFYAVSSREIPFVAAAFDGSESGDRWIVIGYPNSDGDSTIGVYGQSYVVLQSEIEQQVAAWLLVRYLTGERTQAFLALNHAVLPLDQNAALRIEAEGGLPPQWLEAVELLEQAAAEPRLASWRLVRGVVQDAVAEAMSEPFEPGTLSLFLKDLNDMVASME